MYIAYNLLLITPLLILCFGQKGGEKFVDFVFTLTPLLMIDKKGEKYFCIYACFPCFIHKWGEVFMFMHICFVLQMYGDELDEFYDYFGMLFLHTCHTFAYIFMRIHSYLLFICYA